jgi:hypothetical protein
MYPTPVLLTLLAGALTVSMTACAKDLPTDPTNKDAPGIGQADVSTLAILANDDFDDAVVVTALPFTHQVNTSEATPADDDPPNCFGGGATVWYQFTAPANTRINGNTFGSDYDTGLSVYSGTRGALTEIDCDDDSGGSLQSSVTFDAVAGETYFFMAGAFGSGSGGNLVLNVDVGLPPLEAGLTIVPVGRVNGATGSATIGGTVTCSRPVVVELSGQLRQRIGRAFIEASFGSVFACDGVTPWEAATFGPHGLFVGGRAEVVAFAGFFDQVTGESAFAEESAIVRLRGGARAAR